MEQERQIGSLVRAGVYLSKGEFIREAVRNRLRSMEILETRHLPRDRDEAEIEAFIKELGPSWTSDIAHDLRLDLDLVLAVLEELRREGRVRPDDYS